MEKARLPLLTDATPAFALVTETVTPAVGCVASFTVNSAVSPSLIVRLAGSTTRPGWAGSSSSSTFTTTVAETPS